MPNGVVGADGVGEDIPSDVEGEGVAGELPCGIGVAHGVRENIPADLACNESGGDEVGWHSRPLCRRRTHIEAHR